MREMEECPVEGEAGDGLMGGWRERESEVVRVRFHVLELKI